MLTRYDKTFICILLFLALFTFIGGLNAFGSNEKGKEVIILVGGHEVERSSLNLEKSRRITVDGILGESLIEIADGKARMLSSPCPNHNCMMQEWVSRPGDVIVCVPNQVIVKIVGDDVENEIDACNR